MTNHMESSHQKLTEKKANYQGKNILTEKMLNKALFDDVDDFDDERMIVIELNLKRIFSLRR